MGRFFLKESTRDDLFSDVYSALETLMLMTEELIFCCVPNFELIYLVFALVEDSLFFFDSSKSERSTSKF